MTTDALRFEGLATFEAKAGTIRVFVTASRALHGAILGDLTNPE